jgi:TonB-linked SusC/RagA family outer membrane protein
MRVLRSSWALVLAILALSEVLPAQVILANNRERVPQIATSLLAAPAQLDLDAVSLTTALTRLSQHSGVSIGFSPSLLGSDRVTVACKCGALTLGAALDQLLSGLPIRYVEQDDQIVLVPSRASTVSADVFGAARPATSYTTNMLAQADSVITGRVVDESTRQPLVDVRVVVVGRGREARTDARGEFRIPLGGPTGTLEVTRIGYGRGTREVRLGEATVVITMQRLAVQLDQAVISGTAGGATVRSTGNAISTVDVSTVTKLAPPRDVQAVLSTSVPGMAIQSSGGAVGTGGTFRVRGAASLALSTAPLMYVDGVRVDNAQAGGIPGNFGSNAPGGDPRTTPSRMNDFNPEDIESIEIVKGPAAATLYGTEAANGVINIRTKRGTAGRPRLEFIARTGANWIPDPANAFNTNWYRDPSSGELVEVNVIRQARDVGFPQSLYGECPAPFSTVRNGNCVGDIFSTGALSTVSANIRGGAEQIRYYFSGEIDQATGPVSYNWQRKLSTRSNLTWTPGSTLSMDMSLGLTRSSLSSPTTGGSTVVDPINFACPRPGCAPGSNTPLALDGPWRGFQFSLPERKQNDAEALDLVNRSVVSVTATHTPWSWFTQRLAVGGDFIAQELTGLNRRLDGPYRTGTAFPQGIKHIYNNNQSYTTFDYGATAKATVGSVGLATSAGYQFFNRLTKVNWVRSENIPVNALETIDAGANRTSGEQYIPNKSLGMYVQQEVSWQDRIYLTGAFRGDDNSAFGKDFAFVLYPKASASWVIGEESWFRVPGVSTAKLRSAWGLAGQQPDAFVAVQAFAPRVGETTAGLTAQNIGNPTLSPEVASEFESGLDLGLFNNRVGLELSMYRKRTRDAIIPVPVAPSSGFSGVQLQNIGGVENRGWEVLANANLVSGSRVSVDLRTALSGNTNQITSIGDRAAIPLQFSQQHVPGFPMASFFYRRVVSSTVGANGAATNVLCESGEKIPGTNLSRGGGPAVPCADAPEIFQGGVIPTWQGSTALTVSIGSRLQLFTNVEYVGGNMLRNAEVGAGFQTFGNARAWLEERDPILMGLRAITFDSRSQWATMDMSYARLREIAGTYTFSPSESRRIGVSQASATLAWSGNIWTFWRGQQELFGRFATDPSVRENGNFRASGGYAEGQSGNQQGVFPTMQRLQLTLRLVP